MRRQHDIKWFLEEPTRLLQMKPFTRRGNMNWPFAEGMTIKNGAMQEATLSNLDLKPITQDLYITEYRPDLHHIILNKSIPKIKVKIDGVELPSDMLELTQTASFQKLIHSAHVRNLTANNLEFTLYGDSPLEEERKAFSYIKQEWLWRGLEWNKYMAINTCKQLGNCGVLFSFDPTTKKYSVKNFSYEDGYQIIPNYDEFGEEVARSLTYEVDGKRVIDTFDNEKYYRSVEGAKGWELVEERKHGYPRIPLLHKRGKVAWEYAESSIEMWELMANIAAIALKRFGTFALAFWGEMDKGGLQRDASTLIINLSSDTTNGKQDVKVLDFPEPQTMDGYLKTLEEKISLFSSTSFITPKDITTSNSGGNGIALAMSNDYSLAVQSALDWQHFVNEMVYLHQVGLDLEEGVDNKYAKIRIGAKIIPWSLETTNTKLINLGMEAPYLSTQTIVEKCPDAAPDEADRIKNERGDLITRDAAANIESNAKKAASIAANRNDIIRDNEEEYGIAQAEINS